MIRNGLLGILIMTSASGAIIAVPAEAADLYTPGVYKALPKRSLSYPYGGTYLDISYAKRSYGYPYVGFYYGNYYAAYYGNYYGGYSGYSSYSDRQNPCFDRVRGCR